MPDQPAEAAEARLAHYNDLPTKAAKIRALLDEGYSRSEIAKALKIRYQHVRNVDIQRPKSTESVASRDGSSRIDLELPAAVKEIIEHAAKLSGRKVSDFVIAGALDAANTTIERIGRAALSARDSKKVAESLIDPPTPSGELKSLLRR